jgi:hypothetical protein
MISTLIAGLSILFFSGMANTYFSEMLFSDTELPSDKNNKFYLIQNSCLMPYRWNKNYQL